MLTSQQRNFFQQLQALNRSGMGRHILAIMERKANQQAAQLKASGAMNRTNMGDLQIAYNWIWWGADPTRTPQPVKELLIHYVGECPECGEPLMVNGGNAYSEDGDTALCDDECKFKWDRDHNLD
jgi:hypothetical protein